MKLSNKILLGFFGLIFIYITAAFTELKMTGTPGKIDDKNSKGETVDISGVRYLSLNNANEEIHVIGSDRAQLEVRSMSGDLLQKLKYKVSGDTLIISDFDSEKMRGLKISLFVPKSSIKGITVNNTVAIIRGLESQALSISQKSASVWLNETTIGRLDVNLDKSYLELTGTNLDTVSTEATRSRMNIFMQIDFLQGSIENNTFLQVQDLEEIQLKKDESSRLNIYQ